ncbi:unnamed protein product [Linum trigynum]|uniref:Uncharacterized protein n=1 Tax=Linum trigynum TaxID=586398 RepID=A0AAV2FHG9_9ROSI
MAHAVVGVPLDFSYLLFGVFMTFADSSFPGPLPFGPFVTQLILRLGISIYPFRTEQPSWFFLIDQVLEELEIANEGEINVAAEDVNPEGDDDPEEEAFEEEAEGEGLLTMLMISLKLTMISLKLPSSMALQDLWITVQMNPLMSDLGGA